MLYQLSYFRIFSLLSLYISAATLLAKVGTVPISRGKVVLYQLSYFRIFSLLSLYISAATLLAKVGTVPISRGKVVLYQLSYFRIFYFNIPERSLPFLFCVAKIIIILFPSNNFFNFVQFI